MLRVSGLTVTYSSARGAPVVALRNLHFTVNKGECLGVLGESGCGKSSLALALLRLLPSNAQVTGTIEFGDKNLSELPSDQLRRVRGGAISLVFQEPALALNPVLPVRRQLADVLTAHRSLSADQIAARLNEVLKQVGLPDTERVLHAFPHQLSGGQRQRVAIAQALICGPSILIADEPLSSLDTVTQAEIAALLASLRKELGLTMIFITHDAGVLNALADRVVVMRHGEIVAEGAMATLRDQADPYVQGLVTPEKLITTPLHSSQGPQSQPPLLEIRNLSKRFIQKSFFSRTRFPVQALDSISFGLPAGTTTAVVGRSGSGKSTLARCIAGFGTADSGEMLFEGKPDFDRRKVQMVFQDPATSLNPRFTAEEIIAEPLEIAGIGTPASRRDRARQLMQEVELQPGWGQRRSNEFSGGQRQRLALARSLAASPRLLVLDEAFSSLDLPLQAQMVRLLLELQARHGMTYLYISHDIQFLPWFAENVVIMDSGKIVERTTVAKLRSSSQSATLELVKASDQLHLRRMEAAV